MIIIQVTILIVLLFNPILSVEIGIDDPDYGRTITELIESRGFNYETHYITTEDSYILTVYRLINPFVKLEDRKKLKPIILQHGFMGSAVDFIINAPDGDAIPCDLSDSVNSTNLNNEAITNNLGYLLANLCYDVWLSNSRGNRYSRNHTILDPDRDAEYWRFTFDEMMFYDAPAIIDHILSITGFSSLGWIGHSQGTTIMIGLLSQEPYYSLKVKPFIALAPVAYVKNIMFSARVAARLPGVIWALRQVGGELSDDNIILRIVEQISCGRWEPKVCENLLYPLLGYNIELLNKTRMPVYRSQGYSGSSLWNMIHFAQNIDSGDFRRFDYGKSENKIRYGGPSPPKYPLTQVNSTQIALLYSKSDTLGDYKDVTRLIETLKVPLLRDYFIPLPSWNHLDFIYATDLYKYVHTQILDILHSTYLSSD